MSDSDLDSDLNDPDVEELELLRRALRAQYTAVSPLLKLYLSQMSLLH